MATPAQLAALAQINRQSVQFYRDANQIGSIGTYHRASVARIRSQGRQSITVIEEETQANPPAVPGNVAASTLSSSSIRVTCDDVVNETGYKWYRNTTNNSGTASLVGTTGLNIAAFTDSGLSASTTYYYWVKATNANGDSAFSTVASTATSAPTGGGSSDQFLGTYLGHFRFDRNGLSSKMFNRDALIAPHPDGDKLYYAVSGPGIQNLGASGGQRGYVTAITIPSIASLSPSHDITQSPQAVAPSSGNWVEVIEAYANHRVAIGNVSEADKYKNNRIGGMAYDAVSGKLWLNFGLFYAVGSQLEPSLLEFNPSTLAPVGSWYMPTSSGGLNRVSGPNGRLVSLAGTSLSAIGDFLVTPYWLTDSYGPRWGTADAVAGNVTVQSIIQHPSANPHPQASLFCSHGGALVTPTHLLTPMRNGVDGWYGLPTGIASSSGAYIVGPRNITPDPWSNAKGYHAPPYHAEIWATPISEILEVDSGIRSEDACNHTVVDITGRMLRSVTDDFTVGGTGSPVSLTTYRSAIDAQLCQMNGYYFLLEQEVELDGFRQHVVHVWSGEN